MSNMPDLDSNGCAPRCRLQRLLNPRSISMYESTPTPEFLRARSSQSFQDYKRLPPPPVSNPLKLGSFKSYLFGRPLSSSILDLGPSSEYLKPQSLPSPLAICVSTTASTSHTRVTSGPEPLHYHPALTTCVSTTASPSPIKKVKRKPPPLILVDSFQSPAPHSPASVIAINNPNPALLTASTLLTPISPQHRMPSEKEQFRRRLLKLQRTLGEPITPGLINRPKPATHGFTRPCPPPITSLTFDYFPTPRSTLCHPTDQDLLDLEPDFPRGRPLSHRRQSSAPVPSSPSVHSPMLSFLLPETVPLTPLTLSGFVNPVMPKSATPTGQSFDFVVDYDIQDSSSEEDEYDSQTTSLFDDSRPSSPSSDYVCEEDDIPLDMPCIALDRNGRAVSIPPTPGVRRTDRRNGWSGEWNQPHIQNVIEKLRTL